VALFGFSVKRSIGKDLFRLDSMTELEMSCSPALKVIHKKNLVSKAKRSGSDGIAGMYIRLER
jgi:hypothetical protein